jgi:hypothetical protein
MISTMPGLWHRRYILLAAAAHLSICQLFFHIGRDKNSKLNQKIQNQSKIYGTMWLTEENKTPWFPLLFGL